MDVAPPSVDVVSGPCVVALRIDDCCQPAVAADAHAVASDPCFVLWPPPQILDPACVARWPAECDRIACRLSGPPSRVAARVDGVCRFVDECAEASDCAYATDMRSCCPCADGYPPDFVAQAPCLVTEGEDAPASCLPDCRGVQCEQCLPPPLLQCAHGTPPMLSQCRGLWPD